MMAMHRCAASRAAERSPRRYRIELANPKPKVMVDVIAWPSASASLVASCKTARARSGYPRSPDRGLRTATRSRRDARGRTARCRGRGEAGPAAVGLSRHLPFYTFPYFPEGDFTGISRGLPTLRQNPRQNLGRPPRPRAARIFHPQRERRRSAGGFHERESTSQWCSRTVRRDHSRPLVRRQKRAPEAKQACPHINSDRDLARGGVEFCRQRGLKWPYATQARTLLTTRFEPYSEPSDGGRSRGS
jgi:hypothetical protein